MRFEEIAALLEGVPYIKPERARRLYDFVIEQGPRECLELGFAHGASSCYVAAALEARGAGRLTSVDILDSAGRRPPIETLLARSGLAHRVRAEREVNSYNWFLKKRIVERTCDGHCEPLYDFCFIDGAKNWTVDGFAFFLVDKLLRPGGWILFDDMSWTYAGAEAAGKPVTDGIVHRELSGDQLAEPNVALVFDYLVAQHPGYDRLRRDDASWAWARKRPAPARPAHAAARG